MITTLPVCGASCGFGPVLPWCGRVPSSPRWGAPVVPCLLLVGWLSCGSWVFRCCGVGGSSPWGRWFVVLLVTRLGVCPVRGCPSVVVVRLSWLRVYYLQRSGEGLFHLPSRGGSRFIRFGFSGMGLVFLPIVARVGVVDRPSSFVPLCRAPF